MGWKKYGKGKFISEKKVSIRSLRVKDENGVVKRFRLSTVWDFNAQNFTKRPARAQLFKNEEKKIGVLITGDAGGFVKVGKNCGIFPQVFSSLDAISKKARRKLLKEFSVEFFEEDGILIAKEKSELFD